MVTLGGWKPNPKPQKKQKQKQKYIAARTPKRAAQEKQYHKNKQSFLQGKYCAVFPHLQAQQVHHIKGREGHLLLDQSNWLAVSDAGHKRIEANPRWARDKGFTIKRTT